MILGGDVTDDYNDVSEVSRDWRAACFGRGLSPRTVNDYTETVDIFRDWLVDEEMPTDITKLQKRHLEAYLGAMRDRPQLRYKHKTVSRSTIQKHYRNLRQLFRFAEEEGIIEHSPFQKMKPPKADQKVIPILKADEVAKLLDACKGRDFLDMRDTAIIRLLLDTGMRVSELTGVKLTDVDFQLYTMLITGKGDKQRVVGFGEKTYTAVRRYLRARQRHPKAANPHLWIAEKGAFTHHGVRDMLTRRGNQAGVLNVHPHRFRHQFAHTWLRDGGNETDLMLLAGWSSPQMLRRYGASAASERAVEAHRRQRIGDRY